MTWPLTPIRVADYIAQFVSDLGVTHIFMVPGGAAMHLNDAFGKNERISCIANLHEQASAIGAEGYARIRNSLGVALVTAGPGATNTLTGVAGAWLDSTPVLFISGQVKTSDLKSAELGVRQYGVQEIDIVSMVRPITKYAVTVLCPETIRYHLEKAIHLATSGRKGPVWLDIPLDVQGSMIDPTTLTAFAVHPSTPSRHLPNFKTQLRDVIKLLSKAERPVLLVGNGVRSANAVNNLNKLVQHLKLPVLTTWLGMDLVNADSEYYFGRPGGIAPRSANFTIQNSDFLLVIGSRLDLGLVGYSYENFAREARKVIVDIDANELSKYPFSLAASFCMDADYFIAELLSLLHNSKLPAWHAWLARCRAWKDAYPLLPNDYVMNSDRVSMYYFSKSLSDQLGPDDIIVPGSSGFACEIFLLMYECKYGQRIFHNRGTGSMGFGLPSSIGAAVGSDGRRTVCVDGDGGLQMNIQELETMSRLRLDIKLFIINNAGYASIRSSQLSYFERLNCADATSGLTLPCLESISKAYGLPYMRIGSDISVESIVADVLSTSGPVVCEVIAKEVEPREPRLSSYRRQDGQMTSMPIEDLYPYLPRDEFSRNMLIKPVEPG